LSLFLAAFLQFISPNLLASSITPSSHLSFGLPLCLLPSSWSSNICNDFDLYKDKTFHDPVLRSLSRFVGRRILDIPAIFYLDFSTILFSEAGCQPWVQPPAILEDDWIAS
jgi:hypothetical protein